MSYGTTTAGPVDLREAWSDLRGRRAALEASLAPYGAIIDCWAAMAPPRDVLDWHADECQRVWERGVPLVAECGAVLAREEIEPALDVALTALACIPGVARDGLAFLAEAWDAGRIAPSDLLPRPGRIGSERLASETRLHPSSLGFIAEVALRPCLDPYFAAVREHLRDGAWAVGTCPFCGGPPAFADVIEDGRRKLACHLCGGAWLFSRTRCPFCGSDDTTHLARLELGAADEGHVMTACTACSTYIKELDRRLRWDGGPALVEDWGSPHFDVVARRRGYRRPLASLLDIAAA